MRDDLIACEVTLAFLVLAAVPLLIYFIRNDAAKFFATGGRGIIWVARLLAGVVAALCGVAVIVVIALIFTPFLAAVFLAFSIATARCLGWLDKFVG